MAKGSIRIARRYAKALLGLYEASKLEAARNSLNEVAKIWEEQPLLRSTILNPGHSLAERQSVLRSIAQKVAASDTNLANFLALVLDAGRISGIGVMAQEFSAMIDELKKMLSLKVSSATKVPENEARGFQQALEKDFGSLASVEWKEDADLIGGLRVRVGDRLLDSSVRGALERLEASLLGS